MVTIDIKAPIQMFNLNELVAQNRNNRFGAAAKKKKAMQQLALLIKPQIKEKLTGKYRVTAKWRVSNRNRDLDNLLLKNIFDTMQEVNLLENDNLKHIAEITHQCEVVKKDQEGVTVMFEVINE